MNGPSGLPPESERDLILAAASGDVEARGRLVEAFLPAIGGVARLYRGFPRIDRGELMQEGVVGLLTAAGRYDSTLGTPFWAYASWWVRQAMQHLVAEVTGPVVLSDRAARMLARIREARRRHHQAHGREPTIDELAAATELRPEQVESLLAIERAPRGLEEPLHNGDGEGSIATFGDLLSDPVSEDEYERVLDRTRINNVRHLASRLDKRERGIVFAHYGLGRPEQTLRDIAGEHGLSVERVRQIEERALQKLRSAAAMSTSAADA